MIFSFSAQRDEVDDRLAARGARALRHVVDLEPVDAAAVGEAQDVVVRVGDEQASTKSSSLVAVACLPRPPRFCARYSATGCAFM